MEDGGEAAWFFFWERKVEKREEKRDEAVNYASGLPPA